MQITKNWAWIFILLFQELWILGASLHTDNISQKDLALSLEHYIKSTKYLHRKEKKKQGFKSSDKIDNAFFVSQPEKVENMYKKNSKFMRTVDALSDDDLSLYSA